MKDSMVVCRSNQSVTKSHTINENKPVSFWLGRVTSWCRASLMLSSATRSVGAGKADSPSHCRVCEQPPSSLFDSLPILELDSSWKTHGNGGRDLSTNTPLW